MTDFALQSDCPRHGRSIKEDFFEVVVKDHILSKEECNHQVAARQAIV